MKGKNAVEEIGECVKVDCLKIGVATVYRTIQLLNGRHLIDRVNFDDSFVCCEMGSARKADCDIVSII